MSRRSGVILLIILSFGLPFTILVGISRYFSNTQLYLLNRPSPDFEIKDLTGSKMISTKYKGGKLLIIFFKIQCEYCRTELKNLIFLYKRYHPLFEIIAVSLSPEKGRNTWIQNDSIPFLIYWGDRKKLQKLFKFRRVPIWFLVDERGYLRYRQVGVRGRYHDEIIIRKFLNYGNQKSFTN